MEVQMHAFRAAVRSCPSRALNDRATQSLSTLCRFSSATRLVVHGFTWSGAEIAECAIFFLQRGEARVTQQRRQPRIESRCADPGGTIVAGAVERSKGFVFFTESGVD